MTRMSCYGWDSFLLCRCGGWCGGDEHKKAPVGREKALWEIADFYNLIKCKYNGCEAEHRDKMWMGRVKRERRHGWRGRQEETDKFVLNSKSRSCTLIERDDDDLFVIKEPSIHSLKVFLLLLDFPSLHLTSIHSAGKHQIRDIGNGRDLWLNNKINLKS